MKKFFKSTAFKILLAIALVLLAAIAAAASAADGTTPVSKVTSFLFSPLQKASSYLVDKLDGFKGSFVSSSTYRDRISELESEVADYQSKLVDYEKLKKQVEAYEKFLEVKEKNPDFKFVAGTVIGRDSADTFGSFVLNCGSNDGVKVNDPVISGEYLIGIVNEVTPTSCVVLSVTDPKVNAAAYEIRTGEMGYTETTSKLALNGLLKLTGLTKNTSVAVGGIVCTSGVGGIYPRGLIIGTVTAVSKEEGNISYYAEVKPEVAPGDVQDAFVITEFEGKN